jgi:hypothetical protein
MRYSGLEGAEGSEMLDAATTLCEIEAIKQRKAR